MVLHCASAAEEYDTLAMIRGYGGEVYDIDAVAAADDGKGGTAALLVLFHLLLLVHQSSVAGGGGDDEIFFGGNLKSTQKITAITSNHFTSSN